MENVRIARRVRVEREQFLGGQRVPDAERAGGVALRIVVVASSGDSRGRDVLEHVDKVAERQQNRQTWKEIVFSGQRLD